MERFFAFEALAVGGVATRVERLDRFISLNAPERNKATRVERLDRSYLSMRPNATKSPSQDWEGREKTMKSALIGEG